MNRNYWAIRTSRNNDEIIDFILKELRNGRLRQGWGYQDDQDLELIQQKWDKGKKLSSTQKEASRHWRMVNGSIDEGYIQKGDWILVPNIPENGRFSICEVTGDYYFSREKHEDYGHIRPVKVLTPEGGVVNNHQLVHGDLRRSLRCRSRMWNIYSHRDSLKQIISAGKEVDLLSGVSPVKRAENLMAPIIADMRTSASKEIADIIFKNIRAESYESVLQTALDRLFQVTVNHTGGSGEQGADLDIVIQNPFKGDDSADWVVPVQVKDYTDTVGEGTAEQLEQAFESRSKEGKQVIAVVLLVTNATASLELEERMCDYQKSTLFRSSIAVQTNPEKSSGKDCFYMQL